VCGSVRVADFRLTADAVVSCDENGSLHRPGVVDVAGGRIAWVGPERDAPPHDAFVERLDGLLMPGLVNVHCHSPMTLFRGAAEDVPLATFLREILWPREARLTDDDVYWGMTLACAELLRAGVTSSCEMYVHEDALLQAVLDAGSRCILTPGVIDVPGWLSWRTRLDEVLAFHDREAGRHERVEVGIAAHAAYTLPREALEAVRAAADERGALVHVHLAETSDEAADPALLHALGFLSGRTLAAHAVWVSDDDLARFREADVAIAHCPQSNAKLAAGVARLTDMLDLGLRVGLGTDGPSSNNDLDLWEEMRLAPLLARVTTGRADAVPADTALRLATAGGAHALGRDDVGAIVAGRWADIVHVRIDDPAFVPIVDDRDLVSHLVWSGSSRLVRDVWVAGERVVAGGVCTTVDLERAREEVTERARRLAAAA
jgi:5-methylthioadenosine/S-adenosylhomocysteine deaminase